MIAIARDEQIGELLGTVELPDQGWAIIARKTRSRPPLTAASSASLS
ncbi:hypothetical protein [Leifsonia poae]